MQSVENHHIVSVGMLLAGLTTPLRPNGGVMGELIREGLSVYVIAVTFIACGVVMLWRKPSALNFVLLSLPFILFAVASTYYVIFVRFDLGIAPVLLYLTLVALIFRHATRRMLDE